MPGRTRSNDAPVALAIAILTACWLGDTVTRLLGPPALGGPRPRAEGRYAPVELGGLGLACPSEEGARADGLAAFDRTCADRTTDRRCGRISAVRRLLLGAPLDGRTAAARELEVLPGIGPAIARKLVAARGPPSAEPRWILGVDELAAIRGIGPRRARRLAPLLGLDGTSLPDICSMGLWPTTSSGYGRLR